MGFSTLALQQQDSFVCFVFVCVHGLFVCMAVCFLTCVHFVFWKTDKGFLFCCFIPTPFPTLTSILHLFSPLRCNTVKMFFLFVFAGWCSSTNQHLQHPPDDVSIFAFIVFWDIFLGEQPLCLQLGGRCQFFLTLQGAVCGSPGGTSMHCVVRGKQGWYEGTPGTPCQGRYPPLCRVP